MTNWQEIADGIKTPANMTPSEWVALKRPKSEEKSVHLGSPLEIFLAKYKITALGASKVALTLPTGISRIEFLDEAQTLSNELRLSMPRKYKAAFAVDPEWLTSWESDDRFSKQIDSNLSLRIDGNVKGSTSMTGKEHEKKGWNDVTLEDLAIAHTAFYLLSGKNLFQGNIVRAAGGALDFLLGCGLKFHHYRDARRDAGRATNISASRSLPTPN